MSQYKATNLDQEADTIVSVPTNPNYIIVGTYSLVNDNGGRIGSLQIFPLESASSSPSISLDRQDFPFGIYDAHFHPSDGDLLGAATSHSEILFFRTSLQHSSSGVLKAIKLIKVGKILVEEPNPGDGRRATITQFQFLDLPAQDVTVSTTGESCILLAATTQFGNTKLIKVTISSIAESEVKQDALEYQALEVHKQSFGLEAWTVLPIFTDPSTLWLLSGGDDSHLIISKVDLLFNEASSYKDLNLNVLTPTQQLIEKRNHEAGVVHLCTIGTVPSNSTQSTLQNVSTEDDAPDHLVLTGSYDEYIRLFLFSPASSSHPKTSLHPIAELHLGGGVWRIIPLDTYETPNGIDHVLLVAAHTAGACIVRLSCVRGGRGGEWSYNLTVEKWFKEGHESLVYAVAAKKADVAGRAWDVVSASFYDKKVCEWTWVDEGAART